MRHCIIIAPLWQGEERAFLTPEPEDLLLCADAGYDAAVRGGMQPDLVIGDFDSMPLEHTGETPVMRLPVHKDDTDLEICLAEGCRRGYTSFRVGGCLGGRMDHTVAALQAAAAMTCRGCDVWLCDAQNRVTLLRPGRHAVPAVPGRKLSVFAFGGPLTGVTLRGTEWELTDAVLTPEDPVGVSNEFRAQQAELSFTGGMAMVFLSADRTNI